MKRLICGLLSLFIIHSPEAQVSFDTSKHTLDINEGTVQRLAGGIKPSDVEGLKGEEFALYDYFSGQLQVAKKDQSFDVSLPRMGYGLRYVVPVINGFAAFGLINKYNAPATILKGSQAGNNVTIELYEGGSFKAYSKTKPKKVLVNGKAQTFSYTDNILAVDIPVASKPTVSISW